VRSVGTERADPGRSRAAPARLGGDLRGLLVACDCRNPGVLQGGAGHSVGSARNLVRLGALPEKLVWDRESAIAAGGRPTEAFAAFCGHLSVGWVILEARDPQAKGQLERSHRFMRSNFEPGRVFANHLDFQDRLDAWTDRANVRVHGTIRAVPAQRLLEERARMRPLPARMPDLDRRQCCGLRRSRSSGSIATTTRSTLRSPVAGSRSACRRPRSPRSCSTRRARGQAPACVRRRPDDH